jgi:hypothetical protein
MYKATGILFIQIMKQFRIELKPRVVFTGIKLGLFYLQLCKERLPLLTAHRAPAGADVE